MQHPQTLASIIRDARLQPKYADKRKRAFPIMLRLKQMLNPHEWPDEIGTQLWAIVEVCAQQEQFLLDLRASEVELPTELANKLEALLEGVME